MDQLLGMEIERKFLVKLELIPQSLLQSGTVIKQWYLEEHPVLIRLRQFLRADGSNQWMMTFKGEGLLARPEVEFVVPDQKAKELLYLFPQALFLQKVRYIIPIGQDLTVELDHFIGQSKLDSRWLAEVELTHVTQAIDLPDWIGEEVTENALYQNINIAKYGFPCNTI